MWCSKISTKEGWDPSSASSLPAHFIIMHASQIGMCKSTEPVESYFEIQPHSLGLIRLEIFLLQIIWEVDLPKL